MARYIAILDTQGSPTAAGVSHHIKDVLPGIIRAQVFQTAMPKLGNHPPSEPNWLFERILEALVDHHTGMNTTRPFGTTYDRDATLIDRAVTLLQDNIISSIPKP